MVFALIVFYTLGLLVSGRMGRRAIDWQSAILSRIPVVSSIYNVVKQATDAMSTPSGHQYSRVVFLEWPRPGVMAMGFVTGHCHSPVDARRTLLVVYIPTVPIPTSGMLAFVSEEDITETNLRVEEAMKMVLSGGIVLPDAMNMHARVSLSKPPQS